jgi:hypothetical protein
MAIIGVDQELPVETGAPLLTLAQTISRQLTLGGVGVLLSLDFGCAAQAESSQPD